MLKCSYSVGQSALRGFVQATYLKGLPVGVSQNWGTQDFLSIREFREY